MQVTPDDLKSLTPDRFEQAVAQLLANSGFRNIVGLGGSGDEGIDLRAEWLEELPTGHCRMTVWAVQCKRYANSLSQQQIRDVISAALEPPLDLLPARPDFFLIATSSSLSPNSRRLVERANNDHAKYGCRFVVWDGDTIAGKLSHQPAIVERLFPPATTRPRAPMPRPLIRLSILLDRIGDQVLLTFLFELDEVDSATRVARSELSEQEFNDVLMSAARATTQTISETFDEQKKAVLCSLGTRIAHLIPSEIRTALFSRTDAYVRLASNAHVIPFELAYDEASDRFLGASLRIGRIQISDSAPVPRVWPQPAVLLVDPGPSTHEPQLKGATEEAHQISKILSAEGISVTTLSGNLATRETIEEVLRNKDYQIIHFAGHGVADADQGNGLRLADGLLTFDDVLSRPLSGTPVVFLSACKSGVGLSDASQQFFRSGAGAFLGFIGPVTASASSRIAVKFFERLRRGATLGDALQTAREYQREAIPGDLSWVSVVLFGDPAYAFAEWTNDANG